MFKPKVEFDTINTENFFELERELASRLDEITNNDLTEPKYIELMYCAMITSLIDAAQNTCNQAYNQGPNSAKEFQSAEN